MGYRNFRNFLEGLIHKTWQMQSFVKIKPSQNGEITLLFTDIGKSCPSCNFLMWQIHVCLADLGSITLKM